MYEASLPQGCRYPPAPAVCTSILGCPGAPGSPALTPDWTPDALNRPSGASETWIAAAGWVKKRREKTRAGAKDLRG